ncbi:hypothetical protein CB1_000678013 [Camelus ferus]|nr:hypothetical protein CB1_000678013 [Camelus ferus]
MNVYALFPGAPVGSMRAESSFILLIVVAEFKTRSSDSVIKYLRAKKMSLESLFQHIIFSEHRAEESRRLMREVRSEINGCREKIKKATEKLNEEKIKLESKVLTY